METAFGNKHVCVVFWAQAAVRYHFSFACAPSTQTVVESRPIGIETVNLAFAFDKVNHSIIPQVEPSHWSLRRMAQMMCFRPRTVLLGVWTMGDVIWEKYSPKTPQKGAGIGSFKPKRQNLYIAISLELLIRRTSDLRLEFRPRKALRGWSAIAPKKAQHGWRPPSWKSIWRHNSAADVPIWTKFVRRMHNYTPITGNGRNRNRK